MTSTSAASDPVQALAAQVRASRLPPPQRRRRIREDAGVSLRQGARSLGTDPMTLLRWERGEVNPRTDHAIAYRQFLDALEQAVTEP